jgi:hypothetical protein
MKISFWDILSIVLLLATVGVIMVVAQIFIDPSGSMNPFPRPTMPVPLVLPTRTSTPLRLPATWTPTAKLGEVQQTPTAELKATWTVAPTSTGFVVPTWTPTITLTPTATITRTPTQTLTPTNTVKPFAVTSVQLAVDTNVSAAVCPPGHTFVFIAGITASNSGTVKYHWIINGNNISAPDLSYSAGGMQSVTTSWTGTATFNGVASIYIDEPNHQSFGGLPIALTCTSPTAAPTTAP